MAVRALLVAAAVAAGAAPAAPTPSAPAAPATVAPGAAPPVERRRLEFPSGSGLPEVPVENPHDHGGAPVCAFCHERRDPSLRGDPVALCEGCHPPPLMKHPFGQRAKQAPAALPLGEGGRIVCHTCHDPHDVKAHRKGLRLEFQSLCAECHAGHGKKAQGAPASPGGEPARAAPRRGTPAPSPAMPQGRPAVH